MPDRLLEIVQVSAGPPFVAGLPVQIFVSGRASSHFTSVRVTVRETADAGSQIVAQGDVDTILTNDPGVFHFGFSVVGSAVLACDQEVHVRAEAIAGCGAGDPDGTVEDVRAILCKPRPAGPHPAGPDGPGGAGGGGGSGGPGGDGGDWPSWLPPPSVLCPHLGRTFAATLLGCLIAIVTALSLAGGPVQQPAAWATVAALAAAAVAARWLWYSLCQPNDCVRIGVVCWAMKSAVVAGIPIAAVLTSVRGGLAVLILGGLAGGLVAVLRERFCYVPAVSGGLAQFF